MKGIIDRSLVRGVCEPPTAGAPIAQPGSEHQMGGPGAVDFGTLA